MFRGPFTQCESRVSYHVSSYCNVVIVKNMQHRLIYFMHHKGTETTGYILNVHLVFSAESNLSCFTSYNRIVEALWDFSDNKYLWKISEEIAHPSGLAINSSIR